MLHKLKITLGAALIAASHLAVADTAEVKVSNVALSVSGPGWWYWLPSNVNWLPKSAGTSVGLENPGALDSASVWGGQAANSSVIDGTSLAQATLTATTSNDLNGVTAQAKVDVSGGRGGWSFANVVDNQILVAGLSTLSVSMKLDNMLTSGGMSQANATIQLCSIDFSANPTDTCLASSFVEAVSINGSAYGGPSLLTASWTNTSSDAVYARIQIGLTASATSVAAAVPEPTSLTLCLAGLAGIGIYRRRRIS
jgi:hypothetical protein